MLISGKNNIGKQLSLFPRSSESEDFTVFLIVQTIQKCTHVVAHIILVAVEKEHSGWEGLFSSSYNVKMLYL